MIKQLDKWHKTKTGYLVFALVELGLAYLFVSLSIDKGNFWYYGLTLVFLVGSLRNLFALLSSLKRNRR